uniref:Ribosomal protein S3 n=2 Tax=Ajuga TaxID=38595 RepID=A0A6M8EA06_9LAMI|nr:ribosomal protein S3 [Ajuga decumbens]QKE23914.1 ribosomal protein S3 [Ajuga lupulina]
MHFAQEDALTSTSPFFPFLFRRKLGVSASHGHQPLHVYVRPVYGRKGSEKALSSTDKAALHPSVLLDLAMAVTMDSLLSFYGKSFYQDLHFQSYFGDINPPTRKRFGSRLGGCTIFHFPKAADVHLFLPRRPRHLKRRTKSRPWWKAGRLPSSEEQKEVRARFLRRGTESVRRGIPIWPTSLRRVGRIKRKLSTLQRKGELPEKGIDFLISNDKTFRKRKFLSFFLPKKRFFGPIDPIESLLPPSSYPYLNYFLIQYFLHAKHQIPFDPVRVLNHFVAKRAREQERRLDQRIRSCIQFFAESFTLSMGSETAKIFPQHYSLVSRRPFAETRRSTSPLFPFFGATLFYLRDGGRPLTCRLGQAQTQPCRIKWRESWKKLYSQAKEKAALTERIVQFIGRSKVIETMVAKMVKKIVKKRRRLRRPGNSYLGRVEKMRAICSNRTRTNASIESIKIGSLYQSAALIAQEIVLQLKERRSVRTIFNQIIRNRPRWITGMRLSCAGRLKGVEIAKTECRRFGRTSLNVLNQKIDYAFAQAPTKFGILGIKVWLSYGHKGH